MIWFTIYCFTMAWFCLFMMYRVRKVAKAVRIHYSVAKSVIKHRIEDGEFFNLASMEKYYGCLWDFNKMVWNFWIWDLRYMVNDVEMFCAIYGENPGEMKLW